MAVETLKIVLTADNKQALLAMRETVTSLDGVTVAGGKAGGATKKLGTDFTGMSRVLQDLPFGFMAIQNNLTQLLPAAGAAGLAFSALIAGIQFAQVGLTYWTRGSKDATSAFQEQTKSLTDFNIKVNEVKNSFRAASAGVISKKEALDKYNESLGSSIGYASSISEAEDLMVKNTATVIKAMQLRTQANVYSARAAELNAKMVSGEMFDANSSWMESALNATKNYFRGMDAGQMIVENLSTSLDQQNNLMSSSNKLIGDAIELEKTLAGSRTKPDAGGGATQQEKINGALENYMNNLNAILPLLERFNAQNDRLNFGQKGGQQTEMLAPQRNTGSQDLQNLQLQVTANNTLNNALAIRNSEQMEYEQQLRESQAAALTNNLMNSVNGLFTAMQNGASLGEAFGNMFKQIAIDIAKAAVQAAIFQAILMALPGGGGLSFGQGFLGGFKKLLGFSEGGTVSGPQSGYPVMLHGTEHIVRPDQMKQIIASASQMGGSNSSRVMVEGIIRGNDIFLSQQRTGTFRSLTT
jgi:hypothetical protein